MLFAKCEVMRSICWKGSPVNFIHLHNHVVSVFLCKKKKKIGKRKEEKRNQMRELKGMALQRGSILSAADTEGQQQLPHHLSRLPGSYCFLGGIISSPSNRRSWVIACCWQTERGKPGRRNSSRASGCFWRWWRGGRCGGPAQPQL